MQTSETIHPDKHDMPIRDEVQRPLGNITGMESRGNVHVLTTDKATVQVLFVNDGILRVRVHRQTPLTLTSTAAVVQDTQSGCAVQVNKGQTAVTLQGNLLQSRIEWAPLALNVERKDGSRVFELSGIECATDGRTVCHVLADAEDHYYGLGEKSSFLDKRGEHYTMWNSDVYAPHNPEIEALYVSVPLLIRKTANGVHGIFVDNPGRTSFDMRSRSDMYSFTTHMGDMDFYVIEGPTQKEVIRRYTALTGRTVLPPAWSLGYHQSRYSYMNDEEVRALTKNFRDRDIPCDAVHLDIHYMRGYRSFTFDESRFPQPGQLVRELADDGVHIVPIVNPGVKRDATFVPYIEGVQQDVFCKYVEGETFKGAVWPGESVFPDYTDAKVRKWWGEQHRFYTDLGIRGIWNDMNEPAVFNETKTMDVSAMHRNDGDVKTHGELHNIYGMLTSQATYEGMRKLLDNERPFLLTRAGYAGIGRFAAVWTGDNRSFWEHMSMAIPMILNMGLSGIPFAGPDVGGFAHDTNPELLARWTQMGAFFPFFRNHSALDTVRQEPWAFTKEIEDICRRYIRLRYAYIPHLYSLFYESSQTGLPLIRPLILEYPDDERVTNLSDQFLVGTDLMVAPVLQPDARKRLVYLPEGNWRDYWTGELHVGGDYIIANAPLDRMPMYVREGAILARHSVGSHVDFSQVQTLTFEVHGLSAEKRVYELYEDDGQSYDYEQGKSNLYQFAVVPSEGVLEISGFYARHGYQAAYVEREIRIKGLPLSGLTIADMERVQYDEWAACTRGFTVDGDGDVLIRLPADEETFRLSLVYAS